MVIVKLSPSESVSLADISPELSPGSLLLLLSEPTTALLPLPTFKVWPSVTKPVSDVALGAVLTLGRTMTLI